MDRNKKAITTVFMTGATGHMGREALKFFAGDRRFHLRLLVMGNRADRKVLKNFIGKDNIEVIRGDLTNLADVRKGVEGCDYILHLGAIIPPAADKFPERTDRINYGGTLNILQAIGEQPDPDRIRLVYIATVASMGNRPVPIHWGRVGDPIKLSRFDLYGVSKVKAERAVIESGLKYWVSLRQSGMLHKEIVRKIAPIIYHQPLNNHVEWSTAEDSGRALYNLCSLDLPDRFWRNIYNIGGGRDFRKTNFEFMDRVFRTMGLGDFRRMLTPRDFATRNFHCLWYSDSDELEEWLRYRKSIYENQIKQLSIPFYYKFGGLLPGRLLRKMVFEPLARMKEGTLHWLENNLEDKIKAFWGSREEWEKIPENWEKFDHVRDSNAKRIKHGFDEGKKERDLDYSDCLDAARFRGGQCLGPSMPTGAVHDPLNWKCSCGEVFKATPKLILRGGHWCPRCDVDVERYSRQAEKNQFFAQVF